MRQSVFARVSLVVDVQLTQPWSDEATLVQLKKQATEDARDKVRAMFTGNGLTVGEIASILISFKEAP